MIPEELSTSVLARPNIFSASAVHSISRLFLGELLFADWAGFSHHVCHALASCSMGTVLLGHHNVVLDARECAEATCRLIAVAACVR